MLYVSPEFSWDKITVGDDWKEIYKSKKGLELEAWKPAILGQWKNYANENHPIQKIIFNKQKELSNYESKYSTYDGCSTPLWGLPVKNIIKGYYNFFNQEKYCCITGTW